MSAAVAAHPSSLYMGAPVLIPDESTSHLSNGSVVHSSMDYYGGPAGDRKQQPPVAMALTNGGKPASQHDSPLSYHSSPSNGGPVEGVSLSENGGGPFMQGLWRFEDMPNSFSFIPLSQISMMLPLGQDSATLVAAPVLSEETGLASNAPRRQTMEESSQDTTTSLAKSVDKDGHSATSRVKGMRTQRTSPGAGMHFTSEEVSTTHEGASVDDTPAQQLANLQIPQAPATRQRSLPSPKVPGKCMLWNFPANPDPTPPAAAKKGGKKRGAGDDTKDGARRRKLPELPQRSSSYRGVTRHRWTGRYEAHLWDSSCLRNNTTGKGRTKGRQVYLGGYEAEITAARAYDKAAVKYWGEGATLNHPYDDYIAELEVMKGMTNEEYVAHLRRLSSGFSRGASNFRGVTKHHQHGRWEARIGRVMGNKYLYLGTFTTEEEAAKAYDQAAIKHRGPKAVTNFSLSNYDVEAIQAAPSPASVKAETGGRRVVKAEGGAGRKPTKAALAKEAAAAAAAGAGAVADVDVKPQLAALDVADQDAEDAASSILSPAASTSQQSPPQPSLEHALPAGILPADLADFLKFSSDEYNSDEAAELALKFLSVPEPAGVAALGATQWGSFRNKLGSVLSGSSDDEIVSMIARRKKSLKLDVSNLGTAFPTEEAIWPFSDMLGSGNEELPSMTDAWSTLSACLPGTATLQACMPSSPMNFSPSTMVTGLWPAAEEEAPVTETEAVEEITGESVSAEEAAVEEVPSDEDAMAITPPRSPTAAAEIA